MRIDPALAAWIADPARQRAAQAAARNIARGWRERAEVNAFHAALDAARTPEALLGGVRALFAAPGWVEALIGALTSAAAAEPFFEPPFRAIAEEAHSGLLLIDDPRCRVGLGRIALDGLAARKADTASGGSIQFSGRTTLYRFLRGGGAALTLWSAPRAGPDFRSATAGRCTYAGRRGVADGDWLLLDGRRQAFLIAHARADILLLQATLAADDDALLLEYDARTHACIGATAADDAGSRIALTAALLRLLGRRDAFDAIAGTMADAPFHLRWQFMRELVALDTPRAAPLLAEMAANDTHPEVRGAAARTLEIITCRA